MAESYDPKKVSVIVDGQFMVGFMDGTFVNCEKMKITLFLMLERMVM